MKLKVHDELMVIPQNDYILLRSVGYTEYGQCWIYCDLTPDEAHKLGTHLIRLSEGYLNIGIRKQKELFPQYEDSIWKVNNPS